MEKLEMIKTFSEKMLANEENHLDIISALTLVKNGINIKTELSYVCDTEELNNDDNCWGYEFDIDCNWEEEISMIGGVTTHGIAVWNSNYFNEFTHEICPAPTYMELLKEIKNLSN